MTDLLTVQAFLERYCDFDGDKVHVLMGIARTKENPELSSGSEIVLREVLKNEWDCRRKTSALTGAMENYHADEGQDLTWRLYVSVDPRDSVRAFFNLQKRMAEWTDKSFHGDDAAQEKFMRVDKYWYSELQKPASRATKRFLWDLDKDSKTAAHDLKKRLEQYTDVLEMRETPGGYHICSEPFDFRDLTLPSSCDGMVERKTNDMLYIDMYGDEPSR